MGAELLAVRREHDGALLSCTLQNPPGNILDSRMIAALSSAVEHAGEEVKAIAFEGAGRHFCFGASVEEHRPAQAADMLAQFHGFFRLLAQKCIPTLAIVKGQCLGGGLELAVYCSWIFAAPDALFGQPEIRLGLFPPLASVLLPWRLGGAAALDLCVSGRSIAATRDHTVGLVHYVDEDPSRVARALFAEQLLPLSASSLRFAERAVRHDLLRRIENDLPAIERLYLEELMQTRDAVEGIGAFLAKRPARFGGKKVDP